MSFTIRITDAADDAVRKAIVDGLVAYNQSKTGRKDARPLIGGRGLIVVGGYGRVRE